jgi:hypothetical protein
VEITEFQPLDSTLNSTLYYSRDEIRTIQDHLRRAIAMRKQQLMAEQQQRELQDARQCRTAVGKKKRSACPEDALMPVKKRRL